MTLKNEIEKTMFKEGIEDRIQDIATFMDISVEIVKKRLKTLSFSDYIKVMNSLKTQDKDNIERIMGMPARDPNWKSPIDDIDDEEEQHRRDVKHGLYGDDEEEDESEDDKEQHRRDVKHGLYGDVDEAKILEDRVFKVRDIDWDTEDSSGEGPEGLNLPKSLIVNVPKAHLDSYEDTEEFISDFISNVTGFTHKGYSTDPEIPQDIAKTVTKQHTLPRIDTEKYQERDGLEGPIMTKSGKVVYYDPKEGSYYDPDTDIYLTHDEWKALDEAYSTGSQGADAEQQVEPSAQDVQAQTNKLKTQRTQAMQRLGRDNLGGATAQMAANAIDKAEQGQVLTPIQRQALAHQAANLDNLAMNKDTRIQFRNLLNKLRKQQADQEGM
jgi:hypothetical protein